MALPFIRRLLLSLSFVLGSAGVGLGWVVSQRLNQIPFELLSLGQQLVIMLMAIGLMVALFFRGHRRVVWEGFFLFGVFFGVWYVGFVLFSWKIALFIASGLTLGQVLLRNIAWHNVFFAVGSLGLALDFAGIFRPELLVVLLVAFTAYDMLAAHPHGPVVALAERLIRWHLIPGFILPPTFAGLFQSVDRVLFRPQPGMVMTQEGELMEEDVMAHPSAVLVGAGDVVLPLAVIIRASLVDVRMGLGCVLGLVIGGVVLSRGSEHPRAALPPLAVGVLVPFLLFLLIGTYFA